MGAMAYQYRSPEGSMLSAPQSGGSQPNEFQSGECEDRMKE